MYYDLDHLSGMFHVKRTLLLSLQFIAISNLCSALSDHSKVRDLLLDGPERYRDYDIFSTDEGLEEDIIYLIKRAPASIPQSCSDCDYFQPWDEDDLGSLSRRDLLHSTLETANSTRRHSISPRNGGNVKENTVKCSKASIKLTSHKYPRNEDLVKARHSVPLPAPILILHR